MSLVLLIGCNDLKKKTASIYITDEDIYQHFGQPEPRYVVLLNEQECLACRQQFHGSLSAINDKAATKTIFWIFDDARQKVAEKVVSEYIVSYPNLKFKVIISKDLHSRLTHASNYFGRSNLIAIDQNDSCFFSLMNVGTKILNTAELPLF